ncbi:MAG: helix-turn-helix domain-containing protein, partial [Armatimonadota bacterium]|nr:helix-turn-helix domain-containing protein [Armatimonadota bacterium]
QVMDALDNFTDTWERLEAPAIRQLLLSMVEELTIEPGRDASVTVRLKCYYMPEMTARIPHLREAIGGDEPRLAKLTPTDLGFLALWAEGKSYREIEQARGLKKNVAASQAHRIRKRTGMDDLDEIAERLDGLAASTIRRHMSNLRQRLEVETNEEAITALVGVGLRLAIACTSVDVGAQKPRLIVGEWEGEPLRAALCRGLKPPAPSAFGSCPRGRKLGSVP